ncbi:OLC1v1009126C1 [Oldenlandia corymbosa var. corymbosa]|uniref:OLC1v1009126C1 n=1 Tax=Oldenlandia corymbosa var. corymbosa TaxID=529605 RepID=A0AAV1DRE0_OLDCO|nr:OLC1v1009126C1 [Oldenlandia corymbosa var. corymbosa]
MSSPYPVLGDRPIDQWKVTELKDELKRRKLMTKGLKEDLIKRLNEAIRDEQESRNEENSFGSVLQSETLSDETAGVTTCGKAETISVRETVTDERHVDSRSKVTYEQEQESGNLSVSKNSKDAIEDVSRNIPDVDINNDAIEDEPIDEEVRKGEVMDGSDATGLQDNFVAQVSAGGSSDMISEDLESAIASKGEVLLDMGSQNMIPDGKALLEDDNSKPLHSDANVDISDTNTQVSEVNHVSGFQVKYESVTTETILIIGKNELKDDVNVDDVKLEQDVKPELVQPSFSSDIPKDGKSHPVAVEEPHDNNADGVDDRPKIDTEDLNSSGKGNLDQNSGDDFMDEDVTETKLMSAKVVSEEMTDEGKLEESVLKDGHVDIVRGDISDQKKVSNAEENEHPGTPLVKRKFNGQLAVGNTDVVKRQRRWNSGGPKAAEARTDDAVLTSPKNSFQPAFKRSFSRSDSSVSVEVPKERVVPPPANPPTNSLKIDRFLRPFTLKAVQELLGKTGTVTDFWMDQIKTHCYVSYSSVEEATETRNAVYNLQWPPNGGRLLVAEFVDPQEVKVRVEPPPQSPAPRASPGASSLPAAQGGQTQPPPRPQVSKQQLQQPPPPPPTLSNPPAVREQVRPPAREHHQPIRERLTLPPPPPLAEKAEPPILTLDDLFKKTKATPRIYYLPLSDEQVAARLPARGTVDKQYAGFARRMFTLEWSSRSQFDDGFLVPEIYWVEEGCFFAVVMNSVFSEQLLAEKLSKVNSSQQCIETLSHWCIFHRSKAEQVVATWEKQFHCSEMTHKVPLLYLANDILQNSKRNGNEFVTGFWKVLPSALKDIVEKGDERGKKVVSRLVGIWEERKVFGSHTKSLKDVMLGEEAPAPLEFGRKRSRSVRIVKRDSRSIKTKLTVGGTAEKIVTAFHLVLNEQISESEEMNKCSSVVHRVRKMERDVNTALSKVKDPKRLTLAKELEDEENHLQQSLDKLKLTEANREALVSQLREALQEQEAELENVRTQMQVAKAQLEQAGNMRKCLLDENYVADSKSSFSTASNDAASKAGQTSKKPTAAEVADRLAASTSSQHIITSVLSTFAAEQAKSAGLMKSASSTPSSVPNNAGNNAVMQQEVTMPQTPQNNLYQIPVAAMQAQMANPQQQYVHSHPNQSSQQYVQLAGAASSYPYGTVPPLPSGPPPPPPQNLPYMMAPMTQQQLQMSQQQHLTSTHQPILMNQQQSTSLPLQPMPSFRPVTPLQPPGMVYYAPPPHSH